MYEGEIILVIRVKKTRCWKGADHRWKGVGVFLPERCFGLWVQTWVEGKEEGVKGPEHG